MDTGFSYALLFIRLMTAFCNYYTFSLERVCALSGWLYSVVEPLVQLANTNESMVNQYETVIILT